MQKQQRVLGATGPVQVFLPLQTVSISFTVTPTTYTEVNNVVVDLVFQTNVPPPVVSMPASTRPLPATYRPAACRLPASCPPPFCIGTRLAHP